MPFGRKPSAPPPPPPDDPTITDTEDLLAEHGHPDARVIRVDSPGDVGLDEAECLFVTSCGQAKRAYFAFADRKIQVRIVDGWDVD